MTVSFHDAPTEDLPNTVGAVVVFASSKTLTPPAAAADEATGGVIARAQNLGRFKGKSGDVVEFPAPGGMKASRLFVVGTGDEAPNRIDARTIGGKLAAALGKVDETGATIFAEGLGDSEIVAEIALGLRLRRYAFTTYKSEPDAKLDRGPGKIVVVLPDASAAAQADLGASALADGTALTRDLVNEPANVLYPESYAERLQALSEHGLEVEIFDDAAMRKLGMNALLSVGDGSERGCRMVVLKWLGADDKSDAPFCVIGKGVTFDTGGISIKPAAGMEEMTMDMGGSAVVAGLMTTLARRKAKANVIGIVGLVENMPDGKATRPGDIVTAMSGTTIEIINTDAEGRLVLADLLYYAQREFNPAATVNLATLTGAIIIALGHERAGLFSNDDELANKLLAAAKAEDEGLWQMPLGKSYDEQIKSRLADIKNTGGRPAGSCTAAAFLERFVKADSPWAHLDIAGVALSKDTKPTIPKGASGWGVATLDRFVRNEYEGGAGG